jgi:hypothetical protein
MINTPEAIAEITFDQGWNLSSAGTAKALRYWAHVHFENDLKCGQELWTLFVELNAAPVEGQKVYTAKVYFVAPTAPHHYLQPERKFELCVGEVLKARGVIKSLLA